MTLGRHWEHFWTFDQKLLTLTTTAGGYPYEIDLEELSDSGEILDFIAQIAGKTWASTELVGTLVYALDDLLYLQSTFCSCGSTKQVPKSKIPSIVRTEVARIRREERDDDSFRMRRGGLGKKDAIPAGSEAGSEPVLIWLSDVKGRSEPQ